MAISMTVPMFRTMITEMKQLEGQIRGIDDRVANAEREIMNMATRIEQIAKQVDMQQRVIIEQRAVQQQLEKKLAKAHAFSALEPMLLALPKKKNVLDDTWAVVGPCWGPDFPEIVTAAFTLKQIKDQRKVIVQNGLSFARIAQSHYY